MKTFLYILLTGTITMVLSSCEKRDYPAGIPELEHHYYAIFVPNTNTGVTVPRSQPALIKFPVQLYSTFTRDYDAIAKYAVVTGGIAGPAANGVDFAIVDKNGVVIPTADSTYTIKFPQAKQAMDTIYIKLLNNPAPGVRKFEIQLQDNITSQFDVDIFSTAYRRPVQIN
ncbi:MAG TPA: hypothetical protein VGO58_02380 [Chitinophagaceae bacterium]|nr:hypothetical protein [Chitinophagaceae bacterium]